MHALDFVIKADLPSGFVLKLKERSGTDQYFDFVCFMGDFSLLS